MTRVYLDWNATTPLGAEARAAMEQAMDVVGNPSSVHGEGRAARAIVERARAQVASAYGCGRDEIVFTSSATEAAALAMYGREEPLATSGVEHDCVDAWGTGELAASPQGQVAVDAPERSALQGANSETGILQDLPSGLAVTDTVQVFGKVAFSFNWSGAQSGLLSAHKIGGPKGVGALVLQSGQDVSALLKGGGQEMGRRSGTENVIGIAGFGAAAEAAQRAL
ncbi:MAG: aminotransferase class V-fold PLP-dependent enzyme, partial [Pseudomonadota bacterium]